MDTSVASCKKKRSDVWVLENFAAELAKLGSNVVAPV